MQTSVKMQHTLIDPLVICGIISLTLQAVGFFSPAWLIYSVRIDTEKLEASSGTNIGAHLDMDIDIHMGLWKTSACFDTGKGTECVSISTTKLEEKLSSMSSTTGNPGGHLFIYFIYLFTVKREIFASSNFRGISRSV